MLKSDNDPLMSRVKSCDLQDVLTKKKELYSVRVQMHVDGTRISSLIHGELKNSFFNDCIKREFSEGKMLRHILETYYALMSAQPVLPEKEPDEIKKFIVDRIKF